MKLQFVLHKIMEYERFKNEVSLIVRQNNMECELYSLIANIVRSNTKDISLRNVSMLKEQMESLNPKQRMYRKGMHSYGSTDFVIVDHNYTYMDSDEKGKVGILGAIEVKALYENLEVQIKSLDRHAFVFALQSFQKLIYTNGLEWRFYLFDEHSDDIEHIKPIKTFILGEYQYHIKNDTQKISTADFIKWRDVKDWVALQSYLIAFTNKQCIQKGFLS